MADKTWQTTTEAIDAYIHRRTVGVEIIDGGPVEMTSLMLEALEVPSFPWPNYKQCLVELKSVDPKFSVYPESRWYKTEGWYSALLRYFKDSRITELHVQDSGKTFHVMPWFLKFNAGLFPEIKIYHGTSASAWKEIQQSKQFEAKDVSEIIEEAEDYLDIDHGDIEESPYFEDTWLARRLEEDAKEISFTSDREVAKAYATSMGAALYEALEIGYRAKHPQRGPKYGVPTLAQFLQAEQARRVADGAVIELTVPWSFLYNEKAVGREIASGRYQNQDYTLTDYVRYMSGRYSQDYEFTFNWFEGKELFKFVTNVEIFPVKATMKPRDRDVVYATVEEITMPFDITVPAYLVSTYEYEIDRDPGKWSSEKRPNSAEYVAADDIESVDWNQPGEAYFSVSDDQTELELSDGRQIQNYGDPDLGEREYEVEMIKTVVITRADKAVLNEEEIKYFLTATGMRDWVADFMEEIDEYISVAPRTAKRTYSRRQGARDPLAGRANPYITKGAKGWFIGFHVWREQMHYQMVWRGEDPDTYNNGFKKSDYFSPKYYETKSEAENDLQNTFAYINRWMDDDVKYIRTGSSDRYAAMQPKRAVENCVAVAELLQREGWDVTKSDTNIVAESPGSDGLVLYFNLDTTSWRDPWVYYTAPGSGESPEPFSLSFVDGGDAITGMSPEDYLRLIAKIIPYLPDPYPAYDSPYVKKNRNASRQAASPSNVATTILEQLGGTGKLSAMIGAKQYVDHGNGVSFKWPAKGKAPNYVWIELDYGTDTYTVTFYKTSGPLKTVIRKEHDIYAEQLVPLFEQTTGLYLSL